MPNSKTITSDYSKKTDLTEKPELLHNDYSIYPNPAGDFINIDTKIDITKVEVYNFSGKNFRVNYIDKKIDVRNLPDGNYILRIFFKDNMKSINFIKQNQ